MKIPYDTKNCELLRPKTLCIIHNQPHWNPKPGYDIAHQKVYDNFSFGLSC